MNSQSLAVHFTDQVLVILKKARFALRPAEWHLANATLIIRPAHLSASKSSISLFTVCARPLHTKCYGR